MNITSLRDWVELIEGGDLSALDPRGIELVTQFVTSLRPFIATFVHRVPIQDVWRVTPNHAVMEGLRNRRIHRLDHLKYPPAEKAGYGRANSAGRSVLYGSFSRISPRLETKPRSGDLVTLTRWRSGPDANLAVTPMVFLPQIVTAMPHYEAHYERFTSWLNTKSTEDAMIVREATEFVTRQFIKPVQADRRLDYIVSATLADILLQEDAIDGIVFPSVATSLLDVNIAIKPAVFDRLFEPVEAEELMITGVSDDGTRYRQSRTARAFTWDRESGSLLWDLARSVDEAKLQAVCDELD